MFPCTIAYRTMPFVPVSASVANMETLTTVPIAEFSTTKVKYGALTNTGALLFTPMTLKVTFTELLVLLRPSGLRATTLKLYVGAFW